MSSKQHVAASIAAIFLSALAGCSEGRALDTAAAPAMSPGVGGGGAQMVAGAAGGAPGSTHPPAPQVDAQSESAPGGGPADAGAVADDTAAPASEQVPCEVAAVLAQRCAHCHGESPLHGAPMPLLDVGDFRAQAKLGAGLVRDVARDRVMAETMPPASSTALTARERATLLGWLETGALPAATGTSCAPLPPAPEHESEKLDCQPSHTFTATSTATAPGAPASENEGYEVPLAPNHYQCFNLPVPFEPQEQATAWAPVIGDPRVVHHWILYAVKGNSNDCGQLKRFIFGWAPGGGIGRMPPNIGNELPNADERLLLEVHYFNPNRILGIKDKTGVAICTTKTPRPIEAGVVTFGSVDIAIPPKSKDITATGVCSGTVTAFLPEPLHVLWSAPHMHKLGTAFRTTISNSAGSTTLVDVKNWDFNAQVAYPVDPNKFVIKPGDRITTTCTYANPGAEAVGFGERTEDEMCFNFVTVYPISAVRLLDTQPLRLCNARF